MRFMVAVAALALSGLSAAAECNPRQTQVAVNPEAPRTAGTLARHEKLIDLANFQSPDVLVIGDSLVSKWPQDSMLEAFGAKTAVNYGMPGDRVQSVIWRLENSRLNTMSPKTVAMLVGTNNLKYVAQPACAVAAGARQALSRIRAAWPNAKIVVIAVPPRLALPDPDFDKRRVEYNRRLETVASDVGGRVLNVDGALACDDAEACDLYVKDGLHISRKGYEQIARSIRASLDGANAR